jgi:hypothetical protein
VSHEICRFSLALRQSGEDPFSSLPEPTMTLIGGMVVEWVKKKGKKGTQF